MEGDMIMPPVHPGEIHFTEFLELLELSQYQLARSIAVPARRDQRDRAREAQDQR